MKEKEEHEDHEETCEVEGQESTIAAAAAAQNVVSNHPLPCSPKIRRRQLGIIFDIDGTLIAEHRNRDFMVGGIQLRPYVIEFFKVV